MAVWLSDLVTTLVLVASVLTMEIKGEGQWREGGWWDQRVKDWVVLLRLSGPCCLTVCLEWWCYETLVLLAKRLPNAREAVSVIVIVLSFDYLLYSISISLSVCGSTRVSNELGSNQAKTASWSVSVSLGLAAISGCLGVLATVAAKSWWGPLFSHDRGVNKTMILMALFELANFLVTVCGGLIRGMLSTCASISGFYLVALPLAIVLSFKLKLGLQGLLAGFIIGAVACLVLQMMFVAKTDRVKEAARAQVLTSDCPDMVRKDEDDKTSERGLVLTCSNPSYSATESNVNICI